MWLLSIIPLTLVVVAFIALLLLRLTPLVNRAPWVPTATLAGLALCLTLFGAKLVDNHWRAEAAAMQVKITALEQRGVETNTVIQREVVTKREVVRERGETLVQYVREELPQNAAVVEYLQQCPRIPDPIIDAINKATE